MQQYITYVIPEDEKKELKNIANILNMIEEDLYFIAEGSNESYSENGIKEQCKHMSAWAAKAHETLSAILSDNYDPTKHNLI